MTFSIFLSPPDVGAAELELVAEAFATNWVAPYGPHIDAFEKELAAHCGVHDAAAVSSGTAALHLALLLAGVGPGDEVLGASLTFVASANPVRYVGGTPVFVDCDATWTIDPDLVEEEIRRRAKAGRLPKAVIAVDLYGQCFDVARIGRLCAEYEVPLIEDAAEALGSTAYGRQAGGLADYGVMSFNGNKIVTTSGGGALLAGNSSDASRARFLATQARDAAPHYEHSEVGFNYRMSNICAAIGRGQLQTIDERVAARRHNFEAYVAGLGDLPGIAFMPEAPYGRSNRWLTTLTIDPAAFGSDREVVLSALRDQGIESRPTWKPMHLQPLYREAAMVGGGVSDRIFELGLCLPSGSSLTSAQRDLVIEAVRTQYRP